MAVILGVVIFIIGILYSKKTHSNLFDKNGLPAADDLSGIVFLTIVAILGLFLWYVMKALIILLRIFIMYLGL
ncbi:hypothetical protein [Bacillus smithii]|uniref:Uncharacterized protein n=1 Tax=Bacillus smithii 7_3_47FAA TaxID=665952 RepID=G9QIN9_9BACI|nr:hypothetical protein [Bacillus smithii]EHL78990.1 hypothetical protein HMPREF1015_02966 [Bacillus smithii 7_3_47FAA]